MAYEQVQKPSSGFVPVQKKVSEFAPSASRVQAKDVTAGEQEQMPKVSTPATDANWLMKHPLFKGNQFLQRVVAPASESESLESEEETLQRQEEGNEAATPYSLPVQAKLTIGEPGDKYEQEADRVASQVVKQINSPEAAQSTQGQSVQRREEPVEELQRQPSISDLQRSPLPLEVQRVGMPEGEELQAKSLLQRREAIAVGEASTDLDTAINSARGGGQSLDAGLQRSMGQAMGADFSGVKVHTDAKSDQLNQSIQAKAFTTGQDVFFRQGAYEPGSRGGQELIAHELTHVVQQSGGAVQRSPLNSPQQSLVSPLQAKLTIGEPGDQYEQEADRVASQEVHQNNAPASAQSNQGQSVQRQEEPVEELQRQPEITALQRQEEPVEELQRQPEPSGETAGRMVALSTPSAVIQRVKYKNYKEVETAMQGAEKFAGLKESERESIAKEFPNWFSKKYKRRMPNYDFNTEDDLSEKIDEMINEIDMFTEKEVESLIENISKEAGDKIFIGYHAGGKEKTGITGIKPFGEGKMKSQIGDGYYIAKDLSIAKEYANQYIDSGMKATIDKVYINVNKLPEKIKIQGISIKEWWDKYAQRNDEENDLIVAAISGKQGEATKAQVQYKVTPKHKETGLLVSEQLIESESYIE